MMQHTINVSSETNSERTSYLDLEVVSRADICFAPQHVSSVYPHQQQQRTLRNIFTQQLTVRKVKDITNLIRGYIPLLITFIQIIFKYKNRKKIDETINNFTITK